MGGKQQRLGVRAISKTTIQINFEYRGIRCRERVKIVPTPANLKRAERHRFAILEAIERGTFVYAETFPDSPRCALFAERKGTGIPLAEYLENWLERRKPHLKSSTWDDYRKIVAVPLSSEFGQIFLADIRRSTVREWAERQTCGNKRLANIQSVLRAALQDALDDELIETNPLYGWTYARKEALKVVDDVDPFSADEQLAILKNCRDIQHRNLFQFAFWTGLRTSE